MRIKLREVHANMIGSALSAWLLMVTESILCAAGADSFVTADTYKQVTRPMSNKDIVFVLHGSMGNRCHG